jgi:hypothetical protein
MTDTIVLGLDGATWDVLNPLLEDDQLPQLQTLINKGFVCPQTPQPSSPSEPGTFRICARLPNQSSPRFPNLEFHTLMFNEGSWIAAPCQDDFVAVS